MATIPMLTQLKNTVTNVVAYVPALFANDRAANRMKKLRDLWIRRGDGVQGWEELLEAIVTDATAISNVSTEQLATPDFNIPRFYLAPGRVLRYLIFGNIQNMASTPGTLTFRVRWGGLAGVLLGATAALQIDTTAHTSSNFVWEGTLTCRTTGTNGTILHHGYIQMANRLASDTTFPIFSSVGGPFGANAAVSVDTTTDKLLSFTAQFSTANASNVLTAQQRLIEALN